LSLHLIPHVKVSISKNSLRSGVEILCLTNKLLCFNLHLDIDI
jgi:hypothetical protein